MAMPDVLPMVPVVGPQFCAPCEVALTVTKNSVMSDIGVFVSDINGAVLMEVQVQPLSLHAHRVLCDAAGTPIISMREKMMMTMHHRWNVYRGDSKNESDLLFSVKKSRMFQLTKTELDVFLASNTTGHCDFKVKGCWFDRSCTFHLGDTNSTTIALMSRQPETKQELPGKQPITVKKLLQGKQTFGITVYPNVDYALIVAIIVIFDGMYRPRTAPIIIPVC